MRADQVADALAGRWPDDAYLHVREAPDGPSRQGRKIDVLVVSLWQSRGYGLDAVEIKVSMSDWRRELKKPAKADWWWRHANRFWIAAPSDVAAKIAPELPDGWGLLSVAESGRTSKLVDPARHDADPFTWPQVVGLLRTAADSGYGALQRAADAARREERERLEAKVQASAGDEALRRRYESLQASVAAFEDASGIAIDERRTWMSGDLGMALAAVVEARVNPGRARQRLTAAAIELERLSESVRGYVDVLTPALPDEADEDDEDDEDETEEVA